MKIDIKNEAGKIVQALANALKMKDSSLCFCGSGKEYKQCCLQKSGVELTFTEKSFDAVLKYKESQGGTVKEIPQGLFQQFSKASIGRLLCLYPECTEKPISCHLTPENILRSCFGGHCLEYQMRDGSQDGQFVKTGIGDAGALAVFCSRHDNYLFKEVDSLNIDFSSLKQQFLMAFKAISFSLRNVQYLLGIDSQVELFRPILILENQKTPLPAGTNFQIDISHLQEQYMRFVIIHDVFKNAVAALEKSDWGFFSYFHRSVDNSDNLFFAGFINPSHDLENQRVNTPETPIHMVCNVFTKDGQLQALFACPDGPSKKAYAQFFQQLENVNSETFVSVINNILTSSAEKPLLPEGFSIDAKEVEKIKSSRQHKQLCMKSSSSIAFDLKALDQAIQFIS